MQNDAPTSYQRHSLFAHIILAKQKLFMQCAVHWDYRCAAGLNSTLNTLKTNLTLKSGQQLFVKQILVWLFLLFLIH